MTDEIKSWALFFIVLGLIPILMPDPRGLFEKAAIYRYLIFGIAVFLIQSPLYKSGVRVFEENRGMTSWKNFKGLKYFFYFVLAFFTFDQLGYLIKITFVE